MKAIRFFIVLTACAWGLAACSGNAGQAENTAQTDNAAQTSEVESPKEDPIKAKTQAIAENPNLSDEDKALLTKWANYRAEDDPDAFYTIDDLPDWGNYRKLNISKLNPEQMNIVVHELRTTTCTCPGCGPDWPLDRCLVVRPECNRGLSMAQEIVGRVRVTGH